MSSFSSLGSIGPAEHHPVNLGDVTRLYKAWYLYSHQVGSGNEREAFDHLSQQDRAIMTSAIKVLQANKDKLVEGPLDLKDVDVDLLGKHFEKGAIDHLVEKFGGDAAQFPEISLYVVVSTSFREIFPLGKAEAVLEHKYLLKPLILETGELDALKDEVEELHARGTEAKAAGGTHFDPLFDRLTTWAKSLEHVENRRSAFRIIQEMRLDAKKAESSTEGEKPLVLTASPTEGNFRTAIETFKTRIQEAAATSGGLTDKDKQALRESGIGGEGFFFAGPSLSDQVEMEQKILRMNGIFHPQPTGFIESIKAFFSGEAEERIGLFDQLRQSKLEVLQNVGNAIREGRNISEYRQVYDEYRETLSETLKQIHELQGELEPYLLNPIFAGFYSSLLKDEVRLIRDNKVTIEQLEILFSPNELSEEIHADLSTRLEGGSSLSDALTDLYANRDITPDSLIEAFEKEKRVMMWAKYAADLGDARGAIVVVDLFKEYGDWSTPEKANDMYRKASVYVDKAIKNAEIPNQKRQLKPALLARAELHHQRFDAALKYREPIERVEKFSHRAVLSYQKLKEEGTEGLYQLFQSGSLEAGRALVDFAKLKHPPVKEIKLSRSDITVMTILALAGIEEARTYLEDIREKNPDNDRIEDALTLINDKTGAYATNERVVAAEKIKARALHERGLPSEEHLYALLTKGWLGEGEDLIEIISNRFPGHKLYQGKMTDQDLEMITVAALLGVEGAHDLLEDLAETNKENKDLKDALRFVDGFLEDGVSDALLGRTFKGSFLSRNGEKILAILDGIEDAESTATESISSPSISDLNSESQTSDLNSESQTSLTPTQLDDGAGGRSVYSPTVGSADGIAAMAGDNRAEGEKTGWTFPLWTGLMNWFQEVFGLDPIDTTPFTLPAENLALLREEKFFVTPEIHDSLNEAIEELGEDPDVLRNAIEEMLGDKFDGFSLFLRDLDRLIAQEKAKTTSTSKHKRIEKAAVEFLTNQLWEPLFGREADIVGTRSKADIVEIILQNRASLLEKVNTDVSSVSSESQEIVDEEP